MAKTKVFFGGYVYKQGYPFVIAGASTNAGYVTGDILVYFRDVPSLKFRLGCKQRWNIEVTDIIKIDDFEDFALGIALESLPGYFGSIQLKKYEETKDPFLLNPKSEDPKLVEQENWKQALLRLRFSGLDDQMLYHLGGPVKGDENRKFLMALRQIQPIMVEEVKQ